MRSRQGAVRVLAAVVILPALQGVVGCMPAWKPQAPLKPRVEAIRIEHRTDGTARACVVRGQTWYQLAGTVLIVMDGAGREISRVDITPSGTSDAARDLLLDGDVLHVLAGSGEVVTFDVSDPWRPRETGRGVIPGELDAYRLARRGVGPCALGLGGVVSLSGGSIVRLSGDQMVESLVEHGGRLLYVTGRRIHRRADDAYLGSASILGVAASTRHLPQSALVFARHERTGSLVGFMDEGCREIDATRLTVAVPGRVSRLRQRGGRLLVVSDEVVQVLQLTADGLVLEWSWRLEGVVDADWIDDERLAIAGSMGTGVARIGSRDGFEQENRAPGGLERAASDGSELVAHSAHGTWRYPLGHAPVRGARTDESLPGADRSAAMLNWSVDIDDQGIATVTTPQGTQRIDAPGKGRFHCVAGTEDAFWLGHDTGIMLLLLGPAEGSADAPGSVRKLGVRVDGPVICIEPLVLGGGVAFASQHGGFGVVREVY